MVLGQCTKAVTRGTPRVRVDRLPRAILTPGLPSRRVWITRAVQLLLSLTLDLQDPPEVIPYQSRALADGAEVVYAVQQAQGVRRNLS